MKVKCLSVRNPLSYFICYGLKDTENRSWQTKYRGTIYIHSSGKYEYPPLIDLTDEPLPVYNEWFEMFDEEKVKQGEYLVYDEKVPGYHLRERESQPAKIVREYKFWGQNMNQAIEDYNAIFFHKAAIVGKVDIVDIVKDSDSPWADPDSYQWVLENAVVFKNPVLNVKGRLNFWEYDVPDDLE